MMAYQEIKMHKIVDPKLLVTEEPQIPGLNEEFRGKSAPADPS